MSGTVGGDATSACTEEVTVKGMMHLLSNHDGGQGVVNLRETIVQVYHNFSSLCNSAESAVYNIGRGLNCNLYVNWQLRFDLRYLLTFCWCSLMVILQEEEGADGSNRTVVNKSTLCDLLADIESYLLNLVVTKYSTDMDIYMLSPVVHFAEMKDLVPRIARAYLAHYDAELNNHQLIGDGHFVLDFCKQVASDLWRIANNGILEEKFLYLKDSLLPKMQRMKFEGGGWKEMVVSIQSVAYKVACYSFLAKFCKKHAIFTNENEMIRDRIVSDVDIRVFKVQALLLQLDPSAELGHDEFLTEYMNCVQDYLIHLLKDETPVDCAGAVAILKDQTDVLAKGLLFLNRVIASHGHHLRLHQSEQDKLLGIVVSYKMLLGDVGSVIYSCLQKPVKSISFVLPDLVQKVELIQEEAIEAIFCIIIQRIDKYLIESRADLFVVFLENFNEFLDGKSGLPSTDHKESIPGIGLLRGKAFVFQLPQSTTGGFATGEIVTEYANSVRDYQTSDSVDLTDQVVMDQYNVFRKEISFLKHVLLRHCDPMQLDSSWEEKLSAIRVQYVALRGNVSSVMYSYFNNPLKGRLSSVLSELIEKVQLIQEEAIEIIFSIIFGRTDEYLMESGPDLFVVCLENFKEFMDRKSGLTITEHKESDVDTGLGRVKPLVLQLAKSLSGELATGEIVTEYVNSDKDSQTEDSVDLIDQVVKDQSNVLRKGFLFLRHLQLSRHHPMQLNSSWEEKFSSVRARYKAFLGNISSVIYSYMNIQMKGRISSVLSELIDSLELIQEEAIEAIFSIILGRMGEYLMEGRPDLFLVCLENFKEFMDRKSGGTITEPKSDARILRVKALVLQLAKSIRGELATGEIVTEYEKSLKDNQIEDSVYLTDQVVKELSNVLDKGIMFLNHVPISRDHPMQLHRSEGKKLSAIPSTTSFLENFGSFIHSCFYNQRNESISFVLSKLIEKVNLIISPVVLNSIEQESSRTDQLGFLNLLLEKYWKELVDCESDWKDQLQTIHINLLRFRSFIQDANFDEGDDHTHDLFKRMTGAGYAAEYLLNSFAIGACPVWYTTQWISQLMQHCEQIRIDMELSIRKANGKALRNDQDLGNNKDPSRKHSPLLVSTSDDVMVGFQEDKDLIMGCLLDDNMKQLDVVSIIGMAGLGKTTLAKKVYRDTAAVSYFDVRAWCCVSQECNKKDLFLSILSSIIEVDDQTRRKSEEELSLKVHQQLTGRRYLIVVDDVWTMDAFTGLKRFFPNNGNGSRIVLTSRNKEIGLGAKCHSKPNELRFLTKGESWDLLQCKIYGKEGICPSELRRAGESIAQKCRGLPLAVVVVGGFLASEQKRDFWEQVAGNLNSYLVGDPEKHWTAALDLSYIYLPEFLKPLFLYLGAFPEDKEISTDKLIWLWITEGLVHDSDFEHTKFQAEAHLTDLIVRSLVMVAKRRPDGRVKSCHIHDLVRDMCVKRAKEENFMHQVHAYNMLSDPIIYQRRLSIVQTGSNGDGLTSSASPLITYDYLPMVPITPPLHTFLLFNKNKSLPLSKEATKSVFSILKLLRVLHCDSIIDDDVYNDLTRLVYLRYMFIRTSCNTIPPSVSNLQNLETLTIKGLKGEMVVPETIWDMVKLKQLHIDPHFRFKEAPHNFSKLENLETLSTPLITCGEENKLIRKVPKLHNLECAFTESSDFGNISRCPDLESLDKLESLKVSYRGMVKPSGQLKLPSGLKKLSISKFRLQWDQISAFQNLEILKLCSDSVQGDSWDMGVDQEFPNLKVLKLEKLNIKIWVASDDNFPQLQKLILERCKQLGEIPSGFIDISPLERIKVLWCNLSAETSANRIQEERHNNGNGSIKVHIYPTRRLKHVKI